MISLALGSLAVGLSVGLSQPPKKNVPVDGLDVFGIKQLHPTQGVAWDSRHWNNGRSRVLRGGDWDPDDPKGISAHEGSVGYRIDGDGHLILDASLAGGIHPRFYVSPPRRGLKGFLNTETTIYHNDRSGTTPIAGVSMGHRTLKGSHAPSGNHCLANTYYLRVGRDLSDFCKELVHADLTCRSGKRWNEFSSLSQLPSNRWIGLKFVIRNYDNNTKVRLETYLDLTEGRNGGDWKQINMTQDSGGWPGGNDRGSGVDGGDPELSGCRRADARRFPQGNHTIMTGLPRIAGDGGAVFFRQNVREGVTRNVYQKWMSIREIAPLP